MQTLLIDGDIILYSVAFAMETPMYICKNAIYKNKGKADAASKKNGFPVTRRVVLGSEKQLRTKLDDTLNTLFKDCGTKDYKLFLTFNELSPNYRLKVGTILPYKGNRVGTIKPQHYKRLKEILVNEYKAIKVEGQEADDALAIHQMESFRKTASWERTIICSVDKDLQMVPGLHYHFTKKQITLVEPEQAMVTFYKQMMIGDAGDNIPGLTKTLRVHGRDEEADKLSRSHYLKHFNEVTLDMKAEDVYTYVLGMYEAYGYAEKELLEIGNLLWLRRYPGQIWSEDRKKGLV
jgi:hypothetical protein